MRDRFKKMFLKKFVRNPQVCGKEMLDHHQGNIKPQGGTPGRGPFRNSNAGKALKMWGKEFYR